MDARIELWSRCASIRWSFLASCLFVIFGVGQSATAVGIRTENFMVDAPSRQLARQVADYAEKYRRDLAVYWLGAPLPPWPNPCPISVVAGNHPAQGVTIYDQAPVRDFRMEVIGTPQRILDSVLPHEITHTILATHFGRPLPRWADEGICTTVEHPEEKNKHEIKLREFLSTRRGIAMNELFLLTDYPSDILPMYAQGYSVCRFLIEQQDARTFIAFLGDYMSDSSWTESVRRHYGYESLAELQEHWLAWVSNGAGPVGAYVKKDRQTRPEIDLVAAVGPTPTRQPLAPRRGTVLASNRESQSNGGWYARHRDAGQNEGVIRQPDDGPAMAQLGAGATVPTSRPLTSRPSRSNPLNSRGSTPLHVVAAGSASESIPRVPPSVQSPGQYAQRDEVAPGARTTTGLGNWPRHSTAHPQEERRIMRRPLAQPQGAQLTTPADTSKASTPPDSHRLPATRVDHFDPSAVRHWR